jgi:hypothetical protein
MKSAQLVRDEAKRARVSLEKLVEHVQMSGAEIDPTAEVEKIRTKLNDPKKGKTLGAIHPAVMDFARELSRTQRSRELIIHA